MAGVNPLGAANELGEIIPVLILNWNGEDDTLECLKSIRASAPAAFVPFVIDNGSEPRRLDRLKQGCRSLFSTIVLLRAKELSTIDHGRRSQLRDRIRGDSLVFVDNEENLGFAKGNNVGIRLAALLGANWVMLLNNDTVVSPDAFQQLKKFVTENPSVHAVTPQLRYYQPNSKIQNCGGQLTYFGSRKYIYANMDAARAPRSAFAEISFITGCALLFNHEVTGPLTEDFFFGEEDYEFSLRMKARRLTMACAPKAVIYHKVGASINKASTPLGAILVNFACRLIDTRNYYSKVRWHSTRVLAYLYLPIVLIKNGISPRKSLFAARNVDAYIRKHRTMGSAEFRAMIAIGR